MFQLFLDSATVTNPSLVKLQRQENRRRKQLKKLKRPKTAYGFFADDVRSGVVAVESMEAKMARKQEQVKAVVVACGRCMVVVWSLYGRCMVVVRSLYGWVSLYMFSGCSKVHTDHTSGLFVARW